MRRPARAVEATTVVAVALALALALLGLATVTPAAAIPGQASSTATASLDDDDLAWGETTIVRGEGWAPGAAIRLTLYTPTGAVDLGRPSAADDGAFAATIQIPDGLASSTDYVLAVQAIEGYVELRLTIRGPEPTVSLSDTEVGWQEPLTVRGGRWEPGTTVDLSLGPTSQALGQATVEPDGTFQTTVAIPENTVSSPDYFVVATGQGIDKLFHLVPTPITVIGPSASIFVSETTLAWEQSTVVRGDLFLPDTTAQIHLMPQNIFLGEAPVGADRRFETEVRIPSDLASSRDYQLLVTGAGADGQFVFLAQPLTVVGPQPFMEVVDVSSGGRRILEVTGHRFLRGTTAVITLLPETAQLGTVTVGRDDTFRTRVEIPTAAIKGPDPHALAVTGQGVDRLFAFLAQEITLADPAGVRVGGAIPPPGLDRPARGERPPVRALSSPLDAVIEDLRLKGVPTPDESADELFLALLLLFLTVVGGWFLFHGLRSDLGEALEHKRLQLRRLLPRS